MSIRIENVDSNYFTLNLTKYPKIYQAIKLGRNNIGIYNIYDTKQQLLESTRYDELILNGNTFSSADSLIDSLIPTLYNGIDNIDVSGSTGEPARVEVINNLSSSSTTKPLSALQGRLLDEKKLEIDGIAVDSGRLGGFLPSDYASASQGTKADSAVQPQDLGTAAITDSTEYATAAQGALADSSIQPDDLGTAALTDSTDYATASQGAKADTALQVSDVIDSLTSTLSNKVLSAAKGKELNDKIITINALLTSDDSTLDEIQELVDFIKQNKEDLDALGIENIAGLVDALAVKLDIDGKAVDSDKLGGKLPSEFATATQGAKADSAVQPENLGSAAFTDSTNYATAAQGVKADSAVQPEDLGDAASTSSSDYATATQGALADSAIQPEDLGSAAFTNSSIYATAAQGTRADSAVQPNQISQFEDGSQLNSRDTENRKRSNHSGTQTANTISDFSTAVASNSAVAANTAKISNANHTGDVTGATALTIGNGKVTNTKIAIGTITNDRLTTMLGNHIKGRLNTNGTAQDLSASQVRDIIGLNTTNYATAAQGALADNSVQRLLEVNTSQTINGSININTNGSIPLTLTRVGVTNVLQSFKADNGTRYLGFNVLDGVFGVGNSVASPSVMPFRVDTNTGKITANGSTSDDWDLAKTAVQRTGKSIQSIDGNIIQQGNQPYYKLTHAATGGDFRNIVAGNTSFIQAGLDNTDDVGNILFTGRNGNTLNSLRVRYQNIDRDIYHTGNFPTSDFATAAQGVKADNSIQYGDKNTNSLSGAITPDFAANKANLLDNVDLNTATRAGWYFVNGGANRPNPASTLYYLQVSTYANLNCVQVAYPYGHSSVGRDIWYRTLFQGSWLTWKKVSTSDEVATTAQGTKADNSVQKTGQTTQSIEGNLSVGGNVTGNKLISTELDVFAENLPTKIGRSASQHIAIQGDSTGNYLTGVGNKNTIFQRDGYARMVFRIDGVQFSTNSNTSRYDLFINESDGFVGINNETPNERLDVIGNVKATNFIGNGSQLTGVATAAQGVKADNAIPKADVSQNRFGTSTTKVVSENALRLTNEYTEFVDARVDYVEDDLLDATQDIDAIFNQNSTQQTSINSNTNRITTLENNQVTDSDLNAQIGRINNIEVTMARRLRWFNNHTTSLTYTTDASDRFKTVIIGDAGTPNVNKVIITNACLQSTEDRVEFEIIGDNQVTFESESGVSLKHNSKLTNKSDGVNARIVVEKGFEKTEILPDGTSWYFRNYFKLSGDLEPIPTTGTGGTPTTYSRILARNVNQQNACDFVSSSTYYLDQNSFSSATFIYSDANANTAAPVGYYTDGNINRYWDGSTLGIDNFCSTNTGGVGFE
ncbi:hypothetical protein AAU57_08810 [Nonlabens sp. YIK11]|uniref:pyocin knob domain-containing protein n=1 Tax=Nonlabens sp. YIK11 TaxID=1453349 RepID=UPI0006DC90F3|nr:pyocin knob domain-containing protein [Nonlabens sp. YIK11]KQC33403.1 hypothetical protein AAU57_08810 [Nonlabens sp. YIK11]